jgi:hypothetical protein
MFRWLKPPFKGVEMIEMPKINMTNLSNRGVLMKNHKPAEPMELPAL